MLEQYLDWLIERSIANDTYKLPRYLLGGGNSTYTYNLWRSASIFDSTNELTRLLEAQVMSMMPGPEFKLKEALVTVAFLTVNTTFTPVSPLLDRTVTRGLVLRGTGAFVGDSCLPFVPGDIYDYPAPAGKPTSIRLYERNIHILSAWHPSYRTVWDIMFDRDDAYYARVLEESTNASTVSS